MHSYGFSTIPVTKDVLPTPLGPQSKALKGHFIEKCERSYSFAITNYYLQNTIHKTMVCVITLKTYRGALMSFAFNHFQYIFFFILNNQYILFVQLLMIVHSKADICEDVKNLLKFGSMKNSGISLLLIPCLLYIISKKMWVTRQELIKV